MKFTTVGDNCIDWYFLQNESHIGGCSLNAAVYLSMLGEDSAYIGAVGNDQNGEIIKERLDRYGVDTSHLHILEGDTAVTKIELVNGERTFRGYNEGVLAKPYISSEDLDFIRSRDFMHTSIYGNCQSILPKLENDVVIVYDFAYKLDHASIPGVLAHIHYGFFSYDSDDRYIRNFLKQCWKKKGRHLRLLTVTLGSSGCLAYDGKEFYRHRIKPVQPVDTMGAGDSFIAGFMHGAAEGADYKKCIETGSDLARETVLKKGAFGE